MKNVIMTHKKPDLDAVTATHLFEEYGSVEKNKKNIGFIFSGSGDEVEKKNFSNIVIIDRGRGEFDHHGKGETTSVEIIAKKMGIENNFSIYKLLRNVELNDLEGQTQPFQIGDLIKKIAHSKNSKISDRQIMDTGIRIVRDALDFQELQIADEVQREHEFTRSVIRQFMESRKFKGPRLQKYYELLGNPKFQRPFDLCEVLTVEKLLNGAKEARKFGLKLLALVTEQERNFSKGLKKLDDARVTKIYNVPNTNLSVVMVKSDNPEISKAARYKLKAALVIQQSSIGIQIYPNFKVLKNVITIDNIVAAIRLEEQILSKRRTTVNYNVLKKPGRLSWIPEWYYFVSPGSKGGRFLLNRSLTASDPEDIPLTKISPERIGEIIQLVLMHGKKFNFQLYAAHRINNH